MHPSIRSFAVIGILIGASAARADCHDQYAGPIGQTPSYAFSSACTPAGGDRRTISNKVCSITEDGFPFAWDGLNWVSGSDGVKRGQCLLSAETTDRSSVNIQSGSILHLFGDLNKTETTDVYTTTVSKGADFVEKDITTVPEREGGTVEKFRFKLLVKSEKPKNDDGLVYIKASVEGGDPIFYLYLPRAIKDDEQLRRYMPSEYYDKIHGYVSFDDESDKLKWGLGNDPVLTTFQKQKELANRPRVSLVQSGEKSEVEFQLRMPIEQVVPSLSFCVGTFKSVRTCL